MTRPLVSICIPTYNRSEQLKQVVESIISQKEFSDRKVEIVINDNASSDDTEKVGLEYDKNFTNIHYFRNDENVRDKNYPLVLSRATGILRKLNNDTFIFNDGSLGILCDIAERYKDEKPVIFLKNKDSENKEELFDFRTFVREIGYRITWIASFTVWDEYCDNIQNDTDGCELLLWQVKKSLEMLYRTNKSVVVNQVLGETISCQKKDVSYGIYNIFYNNFTQLLDPYAKKDELTEDDMEYIKKDLLYNFFTTWIINWELSNADMKYSETENLKRTVFEQYRNKPYWKNYYLYYKYKYFRRLTKQTINKILGR